MRAVPRRLKSPPSRKNPMKVEVLNQQSLYRIEERPLTAYTHWIMQQVGELSPDFDWEELSLILTDDTIRSLNDDWFGKDTVTDVISFAYPPSPGMSGDTGELVVNLQQAWEEGSLRESPDQELAMYIAHGCHHLMGADDRTPEEKTAMLTLENQWVEQARTLDLLGPFFA